MNMEKPISAYRETLGMIYFARMLDKIRKQAAGRLDPEFHANLGKGFDGQCAGFLRVRYEDIAARVLEGGSDEEILLWCFATGRELDESDRFIWNEYLRKRGWNDASSELLARRKQENDLQDCSDIQTMVEFFEYDEGRKSVESA